MNRGCLTKTYNAEAAIGKYTIAKFGASDGGVLPGAASTDLLIGVTRDLGVTAGDITAGANRIEVVREGITPVVLGGTVTRGQWLTSDATGKAVAAAPAAGVNAECIGKAEASGVAGDYVDVFLDFTRIQG